MHVQFWSVGSNSMSPLPMSQNNISEHLMEDWVPSLPVGVSSSFMGWPTFLTEGANIQPLDFLTLRQEVGRTERQWKGFLSWMLGVAGTRHVLAQEGYQWIAPISAFYKNTSHQVSLGNWNGSFPQSATRASLPQQPLSRLRPDYLAIRRDSSGIFNLAIAESKGTTLCLTRKSSCPPKWRDQDNNIEISVNNNIIKIPRHIVVATRSNPNAKYKPARRIQVRAWNSAEDLPVSNVSQIAAVDIVSGHLFGLFRNLGLRENAQALAYSVHARSESLINGILDKHEANSLLLRQRADTELERRTDSTKRDRDSGASTFVTMDIEIGRVTFEISAATMSLASNLSLSLSGNEGIKTLSKSALQVDDWVRSQPKTEEAEALLLHGVRVRFPEETLRR
jgi:hypothetical protein